MSEDPILVEWQAPLGGEIGRDVGMLRYTVVKGHEAGNPGLESRHHPRKGVAYLSDLADADSDLLGDTGHRYQRRVAGLSGYMLWTSDDFEVTAELVGATRSASCRMTVISHWPGIWNSPIFSCRVSTGQCVWKGTKSSMTNRNYAMASP